MISSVNSNVATTVGTMQYHQVMNVEKNSETKKAEEKNRISSDGTTITSIDGDTLTISSAGSSYVATASASQSANDVTAAVTNEHVVSAVSGSTTDVELTSLASTKTEGITATSSDDEEDDDTVSSNLSEYTETELREFLQDGEISQQEYDEEIASRNGTEA